MTSFFTKKTKLLVGQLTILATAFLLLSSCFDEQPLKEENITIKHYPSIQNNDVNNPSLWLQVQFSDQFGSNEWSEIPLDAIEGFDYKLGNSYEIRIRKEEARNEKTGSFYVKYTFLSEVTKSPVTSTTTFELPLKSNAFNPSTLVLGNSELGYNLLGEIPIVCTSLCDDLETSLTINNEVTGVFRHEGNSIKLIELKQ